MAHLEYVLNVELTGSAEGQSVGKNTKVWLTDFKVVPLTTASWCSCACLIPSL